MSRRSALLIADLSVLPEALRAPILGVSCADFFFVLAGDLDRIERPRMLAWLGVEAAAFETAEDSWREAITTEFEREDGAFDEVYLDLLSRALCVWDRPVTPLDGDVEAWVHYQRHAALAKEPARFAEQQGLTSGDELRLARRFRSLIEEDTSAAAKATAALTNDLFPLPAIAVGPSTFPPSEAS